MRELPNNLFYIFLVSYYIKRDKLNTGVACKTLHLWEKRMLDDAMQTIGTFLTIIFVEKKSCSTKFDKHQNSAE